jgi:CelD/BcsL family acetyltransferase involved in cellulose biosynthesis
MHGLDIELLMYTVEIIDSLERLDDLKQDWERLYSLRKYSIFFSFDYVKTYFQIILENFKNVSISIFIIKDAAGKIIAIFPFTLETTRFCFIFPLKILSLKDFYLLNYYYFLVSPEENFKVVVENFVTFLKKYKKWHIMKFYYIPEKEPLFNIFSSLLTTSFVTEQHSTETLVIDCQREFESYLKTDMGKDEVHKIKRRLRRLNERGEVKVVEIYERHDIEQGLNDFNNVQDKSWKGQQNVSLKRTYWGDFFKKVALHFSEQHSVRLYFLQVKDDYIAGQYALVDQNICYLITSGYDELYHQYSPSNLLTYLLMEKLFKEKMIKTINFTGEFVSYEKTFGKTTTRKFHFFIYNSKVITRLFIFYCNVWTLLKKLRVALAQRST